MPASEKARQISRIRKTEKRKILRQETQGLIDFANALRNFLGLDPIYHDGRSRLRGLDGGGLQVHEFGDSIERRREEYLNSFDRVPDKASFFIVYHERRKQRRLFKNP